MRKKLIITVVIVAVLIGGVWALVGWFNRSQQTDLLQRARSDYEAGHRDWMVDHLNEALALDPDDLEALQAQAELLDKIEDPACVGVYRRLSELQPENFEALSAWLGALVRYDRTADAVSAYERVATSGSPLAGTAAFSRLGANLAQAAGDAETNLRYLREAYARDPQNGETAFDLSVAEVRVLPVEELGPTMKRLEGLLSDPEVRNQAAMLLLEMQSKLGDDEALMATAERIWEAGYDDVNFRLFALEAYYRLDRELFDQRLALLLEQEQRDNQDLTKVFDWLLAHEEYDTIIKTANAEGMQMSNLLRPPVANRVAEAMVLSDQLKALRAYNAKVDWTGAEGFASLLPPLARTLDREEARTAPNPAFTRWLGSATLPQLREVLPVTQRLDFERERAAILQEIIRDEPWDRDAYVQLYALREANRDSLGMLKLLQESRINFPQDRAIRDEFAWVAMVLNVDRRDAEQLALKNYSYDPTDPQYRVTWALAQCLQGEPAKALELLEPMEGLSLRGQLVKALAYRLLGQMDAATEVLDGIEMDELLPEERRLVLESRPLPRDE